MTDHRKATDSTVAKKPEATDASNKLSTEAHDKPVVKKPADVVTDKAKEAIDTKTKEVFGHYNNAHAAYAEMDGYLTGKKTLTDKVTVPGADGKPHEITVADRMKELKHTINAEANGAVFEAGKVDQKAVATLLDSAIGDRAAKAKELNLNINKLTSDSINQAITQTSDSTRLVKLQELLQSQVNFEHLKTVSNLPAYTKLVYAQYKGGGYTNENTPVERDAKGSLKVDQRDVLDAMSLLHEAGGNNADLRNNDLYLQTVNKIFPKLENSSEKIKTITTEMEDAIKFGKEGNKVEQEKALKLAVAQADTVNVPLLAQLVKDPNFSGRQSEAVLTEMASSVVMASTARLQYAQFLAEQGRFGEAQVQTLRVKAECPDVMYNLNEQGQVQAGPDGKPLYNNSRFAQFDKLDQQVTQSSSFDPNKLNADIQSFTSQFAKLQGAATDANNENSGSKGSKEQNNAKVKADLSALSASMNGQLATERQQLTAGKTALDAEKLRLTAEQKELATKPALTEDARKVENARIERELKLITVQETQLDAQFKANNQNSSLVKYLEVNNDLAHEDRSAANAKLEEIAKGDPDFAKAHQKELEQLKEAAKEPGWWDRWGKKAFIIGAVVVGVAAGIWLGPGCLATGAGLGTAAAAAVGVTSTAGLFVAGTVGAVGGLGVVTAAGMAGGGALLAGGRGLAEVTHGTDGRTAFMTDVKDGAWAGGSSAFMTALPGIGQAANAGRMKAAISIAENVSQKAAITELGLTGQAASAFKLSAAELQTAKLTAETVEATRVANVAGYNFLARTGIKAAELTLAGTGATVVQTSMDAVTGHAATDNQLASFMQNAGQNTLMGGIGFVSNSGRLASMFKGAVSAERLPFLTNAIFTQGFGQAASSYHDYKQVKEVGSAFDVSNSTSLLYWTPQTDNEANSFQQATRVRDRFNSLYDGQSFYSKALNETYQPKTIVNNRSVFDDALQIATDREQGK